VGAGTLVFAPDARAYFLLLRQKKVAKEKATPRSAPGVARFLALLGGPGTPRVLPRDALHRSGRCLPELACGSDMASRHPPPLHCSAPPTGGRKEFQLYRLTQRMQPCGRFTKKSINETWWSSVDAFPVPLRGAEQRRAGGGFRLALFEGVARVRASHLPVRVAQGTGEAGTDPGSPSSLATFFLAKQEESTLARQARNPTPTQSNKHQPPTLLATSFMKSSLSKPHGYRNKILTIP